MRGKNGLRLFALALALAGGCGGSSASDDAGSGGSDSGTSIDCTGATAAMGEMPATTSCGVAACHGSDFGGQRMGMGVPAPNLTPDATGLMGWTNADIATATLDGELPDGTILCPTMIRYRSTGMTPAQACDIAAYLRSLTPIANEVPDTCL